MSHKESWYDSLISLEVRTVITHVLYYIFLISDVFEKLELEFDLVIF